MWGWGLRANNGSRVGSLSGLRLRSSSVVAEVVVVVVIVVVVVVVVGFRFWHLWGVYGRVELVNPKQPYGAEAGRTPLTKGAVL